MTTFHVATTPNEYRACHEAVRQMGLIDGPMSFPTVYAKRDDQVIGIASRVPAKGAVVLYRLGTKANPPGHNLIKLVEAFEQVLRHAGITLYLIATDKKNTKLNTYVQRILDQQPYAETDDDFWYKRSI